MLTVGSLFSGIGGIDLGLERAGMTVRWQSEIDPYACQVLKKHWPDIPNLGDITKIQWESVPYVDVIAGGYPCQPFSLAGRRAGEHDPRHLWPYFRDAISRIRPRYAMLENVRGHLSLGGLSVIGDLAAIGYDAEWRVISASSVGANHRRDRLFIVAGTNSVGLETTWTEQQTTGVVGTGQHMADTTFCHVGNTKSHSMGTVFGQAAKLRERFSDSRPDTHWWETEPNVGRVANGIPNRVDRLKGLGNAVVPQVAETVGRLIMEHANE